MDILARIRGAATHRLLFLPHAITQMVRADRMITPDEVLAVVSRPELVEDYPEDPRGHSALVLGRGDGGRPIHVVCSPKADYLAVITAYLPHPGRWAGDYMTRA